MTLTTPPADEPLRVSIGMPVYNGGKSLEAVLTSLRRQTMSDIEIIISDNGSTDDTPDICRRAAEADPRIRCFRQPQTVCATDNFNFVLQKARAPYFMWAAHDDFRSDNYLEVLVPALEANPATILACGRVVEVNAGQQSDLDLEFDTRKMSYSNRLYKAAMGQLHHLYGVWKVDALRKIEWRHLDWWHDTPLMMAASMLGDFQYVPGTTFFYHFTPSRWFFGWRRPAKRSLLVDLKEFSVRSFNLLAMIIECGRAVYRVSNAGYAALGLFLGAAKITKQVLDFGRIRTARFLSGSRAEDRG